MKNRYGQVVFITGASSGIGRATAEALARAGCRVYGGARRQNADLAFGVGFVRNLPLDVTSDASVCAAVETILGAEGHIDILIQCAGTGICGAVEDCTGDDVTRQIEVNVSGAVRVLHWVLPGMRARKNGLVIHIGSVGGVYSIPFQTLYSASKAALAALNDGLRIELAPFGVRACLLQPGDIKTGFTAARQFVPGAKVTAYGAAFEHAIAQMEYDEMHGKGPQSVVRVLIRMIGRRNPPPRKTVGFSYGCLVFLGRLLPRRTVEWILTQMYPKSGRKRTNPIPDQEYKN